MRLEELDRGAKPLHVDGDVVRVDSGALLALLHGHGHVHVDKGDGVEAVGRVLHLPDPPEAVQRRVVEVEERVAGRGVRVTARVHRRDVVAGCVDLKKKKRMLG